MKFPWSDVCLGGLSTHNANSDDAGDDADDNHKTRQPIHNYTGPVAFTPNHEMCQKPVGFELRLSDENKLSSWLDSVTFFLMGASNKSSVSASALSSSPNKSSGGGLKVWQ